MPETPGPAVDLIEHAAGIIVAKMKEPHTAPYHWAGALWEAGILCPPGTAPRVVITGNACCGGNGVEASCEVCRG